MKECYFTFSYSAIRDESGRVGGVFVTVIETTQRVLGEGRMQTLRDLGTAGAQAQSVQEASQLCLEVLRANPADLPFALMYLCDAQGKTATLMGDSGSVADPTLRPQHLVLTGTDAASGSFWPLNKVLQGGEEIVDLPIDVLPEQPSAVPMPRQAVIVPLLPAGSERPAGFLIAGVNARRTLNEAYLSFLKLIAGHISTALANATAHEAEQRRAEALAQLDRAKTAFFSNVSHEFRTPLTLMLGPLEDMMRRSARGMSIAQEDLHLVHRNGLRLLRLVNTLLDFSRLEEGRVQAVYEPTDLALLTTELSSVFRSAIERAGLQFIVDCPPLPEPVFVDRDMWEKIVFNLLSNAFKFTFEGEIAVTLHPRDTHVELSVRDTGTGIPEDEFPHLFERFHRVREARGRTHEGTGIGLALVQELVKLHGGTVRAQSVYGQGSTFTVAIPFGTAHVPSELAGDRRTVASTAVGARPYVEEALQWLEDDLAPRQSSGPLLAPPERAVASGQAHRVPSAAEPRSRILLADDNLDMRDYVARLLRETYTVEAVSNGEQALRVALARAPDLVLTDVMMPGLDGFELLQALRRDPRTRMIPVILLSARAGEEARIEGLDAGADDYLIKPFSARELMARVGTHLALARSRREAAEREQQLRAAAEDGQRQLETVLNSIRDSFVVLDRNWRYTYVNPRTLELTRRPREALLGKVLWEEFPETLNTPFYDELQRAVAEQTPVSFEYYYPPWQQWFDLRVYPSEAGVSLFATDITDHKRAEETLRALNETLTQRVEARTSMLALLQDVAVAANEALAIDDVLQFALDRICTHTSWPIGHAYLAAPDGSGDWIPTTIWHLDEPERFEPFRRATQTLRVSPATGLIGDAVAKAKPAWFRSMATHPTFLRREALQDVGLEAGLLLPILIGREVVGILEFYASGAAETPDTPLLEVMAQIGVQIGRVVERQRATEQLQRQQEALVQSEKLAAMGSLLASVAHELNNPLSIAMMEAELLSEDAAATPLAEHADKIVQATVRCGRIVQNFLALARQHPPERARVELNAIVEETVELLAYPLRIDNIEIQLELADDLPVLWADPHQLRQVAVNLITNAHQALRETTPPRRLTLTTRIEPGRNRVRLEVADTGPGIPLSLQARIFEPFFTTKPAGVGTGLGLSLCRGIIESHGGSLGVQSQPGQGTMFSVHLPVEQALVTETTPPVAAPERPSGEEKAVLIIDDERGVRSALAYLLRRDGYRVETAENGLTALDKLQSQAFDLILCDLRMPELDGIGFYRELEAQHPRLLPCLVFLTGDTLDPQTQAFLEHVTLPRLSKPFTAAELRRVLQRLL